MTELPDNMEERPGQLSVRLRIDAGPASRALQAVADAFRDLPSDDAAALRGQVEALDEKTAFAVNDLTDVGGGLIVEPSAELQAILDSWGLK